MLSDQVCQQGEVKIRLDHVYVHPLTATPVEVFWPNATTDELSMSLQGVEMNMGQVQVKLTMIKPDVFQGDILLPICSESQMTWYGSITDGQKTVQTALRMKER
ncbi:hypothetical protein VHP8226_03999 [Vibrio hippocampi]|uniref:Uncharacterized protein n=2 Tax=Vibrio hippocampi TaxID=654686 RepID=A0ABN8DN89_9VIBR|nr:hypothetical protein VHP8226_03999 [Vibrio hippocampi]